MISEKINKNLNCLFLVVGATIRTRQEIQFLPYAGFSVYVLYTRKGISSEMSVRGCLNIT